MISDGNVRSPLFTLFSARAHPDALHGLEQFSFGPDRWRDDNFGLLEFGNAPSADVAHAGGDRADQILAAIVNFCRTEENLLQRAGGAHFYARPSGEVGMWSSHAPVVAAAGRFLRPGKRAPDHHSVCAASERFANVPASAHSAIGNDRHIA